MTEKVKIAIDLMGGDNSPDKTLEGIDLFIQRNLNLNDYFFYLYGDKDLVLQKLKNLKFLKSNYELIDTKIIVSNELSPILVTNGKFTFAILYVSNAIAGTVTCFECTSLKFVLELCGP